MIFAGGQYAEADAPHEHYERLLQLRLPGRARERRGRAPRLPARIHRRRGRDGAGLRPSCVPRATSESASSSGRPTTFPSLRKLGAFAAEVRRATGGSVPEELVERTRFSLEGGHAAAGRLIARGVTGIICASDPLALGAIRAARRAGLSVPTDLSVIGYDDSAFMSCTDPPLTTVRQPIEAIGRAAVELLAGQIEGAAVSADELFFESEVVARGSTANLPARAAAQV